MNQMFAVIGALILLGITSLSINNMLASKTTTMLQAEASLTAISIAQTMIDEIETKAYDAATANGTKVYSASSFTAPSGLGCNATEASNVPQPDDTTPFASIQYYNDVDDYNNYSRTMYTPNLGNFSVVDTVIYVSEDNPDLQSNVQTYYKKIIVSVRHPNMSYPVQLCDVAIYRKYF
jgi:hypothetical protein